MQLNKYLVLLYISIVYLSRFVSMGIQYCSTWHCCNRCPVSMTLSYLYSNYCMKNTLGVNQINDLEDFYPSIFVFETFGTGRFFPAYLWCHCRWDIWQSRAARMGDCCQFSWKAKVKAVSAYFDPAMFLLVFSKCCFPLRLAAWQTLPNLPPLQEARSRCIFWLKDHSDAHPALRQQRLT